MLAVAEPGAQTMVKELTEKGRVSNQAEHPSQLAVLSVCFIVYINISLATAFWNLFEVDQTWNFHLLLHTQRFLVSD